jgi:hypothetical protein
MYTSQVVSEPSFFLVTVVRIAASFPPVSLTAFQLISESSTCATFMTPFLLLACIRVLDFRFLTLFLDLVRFII